MINENDIQSHATLPDTDPSSPRMKKNLLALVIAIPLTVIIFALLNGILHALSSLNVYYYEMFFMALVSLLYTTGFWYAYVKTRRLGVLCASIALSAFTLYEFVLTSTSTYGDAVIRLDMFLFLPLLYIFSVIGVWSLVKGYMEKQYKI